MYFFQFQASVAFIGLALESENEFGVHYEKVTFNPGNDSVDTVNSVLCINVIFR